MFVDKNEILKLLNDGMESEEIAQTLISTLNEAVQEKKEADEADQKKKQAQREAANILISAFDNYIMDWCPVMYKEFANAEPLTPEEIIEIMDSLEYTVINSKKNLDKLSDAVDDIMKCFESGAKQSNLDKISEFLVENGLK